jgi:hypothetical protein
VPRNPIPVSMVTVSPQQCQRCQQLHLVRWVMASTDGTKAKENLELGQPVYRPVHVVAPHVRQETEPLTEMSSSNLPGGKGRSARKADNPRTPWGSERSATAAGTHNCFGPGFTPQTYQNTTSSFAFPMRSTCSATSPPRSDSSL